MTVKIAAHYGNPLAFHILEEALPKRTLGEASKSSRGAIDRDNLQAASGRRDHLDANDVDIVAFSPVKNSEINDLEMFIPPYHNDNAASVPVTVARDEIIVWNVNPNAIVQLSLRKANQIRTAPLHNGGEITSPLTQRPTIPLYYRERERIYQKTSEKS